MAEARDTADMVIGTQFGDEGTAQAVNYIAGSYHAIIRAAARISHFAYYVKRKRPTKRCAEITSLYHNPARGLYSIMVVGGLVNHLPPLRLMKHLGSTLTVCVPRG